MLTVSSSSRCFYQRENKNSRKILIFFLKNSTNGDDYFDDNFSSHFSLFSNENEGKFSTSQQKKRKKNIISTTQLDSFKEGGQ